MVSKPVFVSVLAGRPARLSTILIQATGEEARRFCRNKRSAARRIFGTPPREQGVIDSSLIRTYPEKVMP
jgi:hypothetical protein